MLRASNESGVDVDVLGANYIRNFNGTTSSLHIICQRVMVFRFKNSSLNVGPSGTKPKTL